MKIATKTQFFIKMSITIIYAVCLVQFIYPSSYLERYAQAVTEENQAYFQLKNKHGLLIGKKDVSGEKAWEYLRSHYLTKMFKQCNGNIYSINSYYNQVEIPCTSKWWICALQGSKYKTVPYYQIKAYQQLSYYSKTIAQKSDHILIEMQLQGMPLGESQRYGLFNIRIKMNYAFQVLEVYSTDRAAKAFPIFGNGHYPKMYSCETLQQNIGKTVEL